MEGVEEMGKEAYQKQMWGYYDDAITMYSRAINKFPNDARLLNNRCMCYIELKEYTKALEDADRMILLFSNYKKSHYRKGEVLMNMKKYPEAEVAFKAVLKIDPNCEDAEVQLTEALVQQLCKRVKVSKKQIMRVLRLTSDKEEAEKLLKCGVLDAMAKDYEDAVYYSDDQGHEVCATPDHEQDPLMDPTNPLGSTSLWVGNLTKAATEQVLKEMFGRYGRIKSLKRSDTQYAFINFHDAVGPAKAMKNLQGASIGSKAMIIKYPDNTKKNGKLK